MMIHALPCRTAGTSWLPHQVATADSVNSKPAIPIPIDDVVSVDVHVRPRSTILYTQGLGITDMDRVGIRPGLILDCYA